MATGGKPKINIMKNLFFIAFTLFGFTILGKPSICSAHSVISSDTDSVQFVQMSDLAAYKLFPTQNMWIFIKLDTRNGRSWMVQYSVKGSQDRLTVPLNLISLVYNDEEINGRFTLYETQNMYNFILLDQIDGRTWQLQWSTDSDKRGIFRIY